MCGTGGDDCGDDGGSVIGVDSGGDGRCVGGGGDDNGDGGDDNGVDGGGDGCCVGGVVVVVMVVVVR